MMKKYLAPSIADVIFLGVFFWALASGTKMLGDGDTGWHIVTGEMILDTWRVPVADPFSHTAPGIPWTAHEWLSEVILALAHRAAGLGGAVALSSAVVALTFYFVYKYARRLGAGPLAAAAMTALAASASQVHWLARPHVFSLPLTFAFFALLDIYQREGRDRLMLLPALMLLWVNLHGGYIVGLLMVGLYMAGSLLRAHAGSPDARAKARRLALILFLCLLAACINPRGPAILWFPFHLVGRAYLMDNVVEFLSPDFRNNRILVILLTTCAASFVFSRRRPDIFEGGLALAFTHMALFSARCIPLFGVVVAPLAAVRLSGALRGLCARGPAMRLLDAAGSISRRTAETEGSLRGRAWVALPLAAVAAATLNGGALSGLRLPEYAPGPARFPVAAVEFALENDIKGKMFNRDSWGGYIIYRCWPRMRVFFDGRSDMYGVAMAKEYVEVAHARPGCEAVLDKYGVDWVMYGSGSPLCRLLSAEGKWRLIYSDGTADILLKDTPGNSELIGKYKHARPVRGP